MTDVILESQADTATSVIGHFIGGEEVADSANTQAVYNPATGEVVRHVALADKATMEKAIEAAAAAV